MPRIIISFLISFLLLMVVIALNRMTYKKEQARGELTEHSRNIIKLYDDLAVQLRSAESYSPAFENTSAAQLHRIYKKDIDSLEVNFSRLKDSVKNNQQQRLINDSIDGFLKDLLPVLRRKTITELVGTNDERLIPALLKTHQLIKQGVDTEVQLLQQRRKELKESNRLNNILTLAIAILAIIIITVTFFNQIFLSKRKIWLEGFLESILNTTQNAIIYYKAVRQGGKLSDFKVEYANKAVHSLLSIDPKDVVGKRLEELNAYSRRTELFDVYVKAMETGKPLQVEHLYKNEKIERWLYISISKLKDGITVAIHDITPLKQSEGELRKNITALQLSNQELEEYAYAASHDLQEPLRKIRTFGSLLQDTQKTRLDETSNLQLEKILQSADRMSLLIKDLLSFSSLKTKDEFEPTDLKEIFENVVEDLEILIEQKRAIITHDALPEIEAIPIQINQLFYNLINNSLKFSKAELPLHLDVSCKPLSQEEIDGIEGLNRSLSYYELVFSDNGIGFGQEYAAQIFGLFKRLNDRNIYAGSGIGLALCKKVVVNHSGVILANGKEGVGAQFYIYLPQTQKA